MKRILAIVMALVLVVAGVVCLTACKGGNNDTPSDYAADNNEVEVS